MDLPWQSGAVSPSVGFPDISEGLLLDMDGGLDFLNAPQPASKSQQHRAEAERKRDAEEAGLQSWIDTFSHQELELPALKDSLEAGPSRSADDLVEGSNRSCKAARTSTEAAAPRNSKACRERARRERLNDSFLELATLLEPGKQVKTDKNAIIAEAVKVLTQLRAESNQLRQLNKFLEERMTACEKQASQLQFRLSMYEPQVLQGAMSSNVMQQAGAVMMVPQQMMPGMAMGLQQQLMMQQQQQQQQQQQALTSQQPTTQSPAQQQQPAQASTPQPLAQSGEQAVPVVKPDPQDAPADDKQEAGGKHQPTTDAAGAAAPVDKTAGQSPQGPQRPDSAAPSSTAQSAQLQALQQMSLLPGQQQQQFIPMMLPPSQQQGQQGQQQMVQMMPAGAMLQMMQGAGYPGMKPEQMGGMMMGFQPAVSGMGMGVAPSIWLPPSSLDTSQDHMRRPPAA